MTEPGVVSVLGELHAHLLGHSLPALASASVSAWGEVQVQVVSYGRSCAEVAAALLCWGESLRGVTAEIRRFDTGQKLLLAVRGQLPGGCSAEVYGSITYHERGIGVGLGPGADRPIPLSGLHALSTATGCPSGTRTAGS